MRGDKDEKGWRGGGSYLEVTSARPPPTPPTPPTLLLMKEVWVTTWLSAPSITNPPPPSPTFLVAFTCCGKQVEKCGEHEGKCE